MKLVARADETAALPVGGKARALARLADARLPIPEWVVVLPDAFWLSVGDADRAALEAAPSAEAVQAIVARVRPVPAVVQAVAEALAAINGSDVAVRSSASDEDGAEHSFAGQLDSFLFVPPNNIVARIAAVWRSAFSPRILAYRREHRLEGLPRAPAVLIQRMIDATAAGVAFSADPVSGRRGTAIVSAAWGLGTGVVSGECDADTWHVDRDGGITDRRVVTKAMSHRRDPASPEGIVRERVAHNVANEPALTDQQVLEVAELARRAERHFGRPQDIEWARDEKGLYLLQSRPITSLARLPDPDAPAVIWDNSNIVESYSGVTTPLTFSFASEVYEHVYRQFCRMMRVPARLIDGNDQTFRNMLGLIRGRLYYNLLNWYRVLALLPGFTVNRRFMEQMMGVREGLPDAVARDLAARGGAAGRVLDATRMAHSALGLVVQHFTLERRVREFYQRLDAALQPPEPPLHARRPDELVAHYRDLRGRLLLHWDAPLVNDFFAMIFYGLLRKLSHSWCGDKEGTLQNDLVGGQGGLVSAEPAVRLRRLAECAARDPAIVDVLVSGSTSDAVLALTRDEVLAAEYRAYLDKFGERSVNELKLETATLHDDPLPLLRAIGGLARQPTEAASGRTPSALTPGAELRAAAQRRVADALGPRPLRRFVFEWVLRHARSRVRDRENLRLERTRLFGRVRRIFLEIGRRFAAVNLLDDARDVFYLEVDEVLAYVEGRSTTTSLRELAALRRREFAEYERLPAPADRFETRGPVYHAHEFQPANAPEPAGGEERRGLGCCPGVVRGPVRIVADPRLVDLGRRAVLVAEHTDPGWIMIFPSALGVLVERGSLLSHAAIVSRELGIPGIVSVPGVTRWLKDGDWVELDGSTGVVRRIAAPPPEAA